MKKIVIVLVALVTQNNFAQNVFPATGNVGIGTNAPSALLQVNNGNNSYGTILATGSEYTFSLYAKTLTTFPINSESFRLGLKHTTDENNGFISFYRGDSSAGGFLGFSTNGIERIRISKTGNVGIGTNTPSAMLDVRGTIKNFEPAGLGNAVGSAQLINEIGGSTGTANIMYKRLWSYRDLATSSSWWTARLHDGIAVDASFNTPQVNTKTWWERDPYDDIQSWGNANLTYMTINKGNVGIGTTNPLTNFVVSDNGGEGLEVDFDAVNPKVLLQCFNRVSNTYSKLQFDASQFSFLYGNVGIGLSNPDEKLTVKGKIHTQEVRVDMLGPLVPDYVFANDYKLKSLDQVEAYIKQNSHLPEIPSAKDIEKNGLMLAEMNMSLLKKIEELTLYAIEQNKKIEVQAKEIETLKDLVLRVSKIETELSRK